MATTAPANLNFQLVPRPIVRRVYLATVGTRLVNNRYQSYANQAGNPAVFNRFITRWLLANQGSEFEGSTLNLFPNADSDQISLPTRTVGYLNNEQWSNWEFWWGNIARSVTDVLFTSPELTERLMNEQILGMARTFDRGLFETMRQKAGAPDKVYGKGNDYIDFADTNDGRGNARGSAKSLDGNLLFELIEDFTAWAIGENLSIASMQEFPLILCVHPYLVYQARRYWRENKLTSVTPDINQMLVRDNNFNEVPGYQFTYAGVNVFTSKQTANFTQPGSGQEAGTDAGKSYMTCYGVVPALSYTMINGPSLIVDRGPEHVGDLRMEHVMMGGFMVNSDIPGKAFKAYVRSEA